MKGTHLSLDGRLVPYEDAVIRVSSFDAAYGRSSAYARHITPITVEIPS
jgi:hypothetical protein